MAKKMQAPTRANVDPFDAPEGDDWEKSGVDIEGWFSAGLGGPIQGVILSVQERLNDQGKPNNFYAVRLTRPGTFSLAGGDEVSLDQGAIVALGQSHALQFLAEKIGHEVYVKPLEKKRTRSGQSVWTYEVKVRRSEPF
jgi:hypothetical protein